MTLIPVFPVSENVDH